MYRYISKMFSLVLAVALCGCSGGMENAALLNQPVRANAARLKIVRTEAFAASMRDARVKVDGKQVASLENGGGTVLDVPSGGHEIAVDIWDHPNVYRMKLDAKAGILYTLEVSVRDQAVAAGMMLGTAGMLVEAAANENGGLFQVRVVSEKPIS